MPRTVLELVPVVAPLSVPRAAVLEAAVASVRVAASATAGCRELTGGADGVASRFGATTIRCQQAQMRARKERTVHNLQLKCK